MSRTASPTVGFATQSRPTDKKPAHKATATGLSSLHPLAPFASPGGEGQRMKGKKQTTQAAENLPPLQGTNQERLRRAHFLGEGPFWNLLKKQPT